MKAWALADVAVDLAWLSPSAESLAALVRSPAEAVWAEICQDPAALLLLVRQPRWHDLQPGLSTAIDLDADFFDDVCRLLGQPGFIPWRDLSLQIIYRTCIRQARLAKLLAELTPGADPDCAWIGGLLAPLGWLAAAAIDPKAVTSCLEHANFSVRPAAAQEQCWGLDQTALARRLCRQWNIPAWLTSIIGHLGLPVQITRTLGANEALFQVVQLAVGLLEETEPGLKLPVGMSPSQLMTNLELPREQVEDALEEVLAVDAAGCNAAWTEPAQMPLLVDLLQCAAELHRRDDRRALTDLQQDLDRIQRALEVQCAGETERLEELKLGALAEFAAGAGHEINNPLAVISGQAQYLLARDADADRCKALQTIIGQAQRIHQIFNDLMQFSRPSPAQKQLLEITPLLQEVSLSLRDVADSRRVRLECDQVGPLPGQIMADGKQVQRILYSLLRNAIEAAPAEGWAAIRLDGSCAGWIGFIVEDNGPGPGPAAKAHLFDPFYSGRTAGRGRGLGLPTAWRLARNNGGDVRFTGHADGVTRFVFRLPILPYPQSNGDLPALRHVEANGHGAADSVLSGLGL